MQAALTIRKVALVFLMAAFFMGCGANPTSSKAHSTGSLSLPQIIPTDPKQDGSVQVSSTTGQSSTMSATLNPGLYRVQPSGGVIQAGNGQYCAFSTWGGLVALTEVRAHNLQNLPTIAKEYLEKTLTFVGDCVPTVNGFASGIFRSADYKIFYKVTRDQWCFYRVTYNMPDQNPNVPRMPDGSLNYPILSAYGISTALQWTGTCPAG